MKLILGLLAIVPLILNGIGWFAIYETALDLGVLPKSTTTKSIVSTTIESSESTATVTSDALNMRNIPSAEGALVTTLKKGDRLDITGNAQNGWLPVKINDSLGFVNALYVSIDEK
jgi:uncharacterized protein YraI